MTAPIVELKVPCSPEYVSVVRLAILGLCGRIPLSYDEVEDLRLAVGEACASSVDRASQAGADHAHIHVAGSVDDARIVLEIRDDVPLPPETEPEEEPSALDQDFDSPQFRVSLMQLLVDSVEIDEAEGGGQIVRLTKNCELTG